MIQSVDILEFLHIKSTELISVLNYSNPFALRMLRGLIAEFYLLNYLINKNFNIILNNQNDPFDFCIEKNGIRKTIQLKLQRQKNNLPLLSQNLKKTYPPNLYIVEIQRARNGFTKNGDSTRPYKFTDFNILAVCLEPSSKNWSDFTFCLTENLKPDSKNPLNIYKYQIIEENDYWNRELESLF